MRLGMQTSTTSMTSTTPRGSDDIGQHRSTRPVKEWILTNECPIQSQVDQHSRRALGQVNMSHRPYSSVEMK